MKLIVGIGNPGRKYEFTRHNAGFIILDRFAEKSGLCFKPSKFQFYQAGGELNSTPFFLMKPTTYVNNSGEAIIDFTSTHSMEPQDILVIHDDLNLPIGKVKIKRSGASGGHNGIESIIYHLEEDNFPRIRFGIGNNFGKGEMADYVLDKFEEKDSELLNTGADLCINLIEKFIFSGYKGMADYFSLFSLPPKDDNTSPKNE